MKNLTTGRGFLIQGPSNLRNVEVLESEGPQTLTASHMQFSGRLITTQILRQIHDTMDNDSQEPDLQLTRGTYECQEELPMALEVGTGKQYNLCG